MNWKILLPIILAPIILIGSINYWSVATGRRAAHQAIDEANNRLYPKLCALERYDGTLSDCSLPTGERFYKTTPGPMIADAPEGFYNENGDLIVYCGGFTTAETAEANQEVCKKYSHGQCGDITSSCATR